MNAATAPRLVGERLLLIDPVEGRWSHCKVADLPSLLGPRDLLVVNDAATMPASLRVANCDVEVRLVRRLGNDAEWTAVLFGAGDFRTPTEHRPDPPRLTLGVRLDFGAGFVGEITRVDRDQPRLFDLRFNLSGAALWAAAYRQARPVQYAYLRRELPLWSFQNTYASRPWALEMPSAGHCLTWSLLFELRVRGVGLARITHAAGISSTGSAELDRMLPLPERYEIDEDAVRAIAATRAQGGRVIAVGTTAVRALESCFAEFGKVVSGEREARLVLGPGFRPRVVNGILSGMHEPSTSHFALLEAFAPRALLDDALGAAERAGYLQHEFGDATLVLASAPPRNR
ncbi:MAG TPA: S-adenosylmethionine:tRNA ribosyltransferase-isomerase [Polyangiaceae bacterium]